MKKRIRAVFALLLALLLLISAGCGDEKEAEKADTDPVEDEQKDSAVLIIDDAEEPDGDLKTEQVKEPEYTGPYNPLTGLPVEEDISGNRPYAVMINNLKKANPQEGVSQADIIYEAEVEGGITRMMAVYQDISDVDVVGSCRSARHYYLDIAQGLDAVYVHAGGSPQAYTAISNRGIDNIDGVNGSGETFYRDSARRSSMGYEHSLMLDPSLLPAYVEKHKISTTHRDGYESNMTFADDDEILLASPVAANKITANFSASKSTTFAYNAEDGLYYASQHGGAYTDGHYGIQVSAKNVITIFANVYAISGDDKGRMETILTGSGNGYFAVNGQYIPITWEKASTGDQFVFKAADGTPVVFGRGMSYICIVDQDNEVTIE